jgi:hypothetical protein
MDPSALTASFSANSTKLQNPGKKLVNHVVQQNNVSDGGDRSRMQVLIETMLCIAR